MLNMLCLVVPKRDGFIQCDCSGFCRNRLFADFPVALFEKVVSQFWSIVRVNPRGWSTFRLRVHLLSFC